jgi:cyclase
MKTIRLIARLDIKGPNLIKGIQFEGQRVVGDPHRFALEYYAQGMDEIIFLDTVASLYGRNNLKDIVSRTAAMVFIPLTVGGGIRSVADVLEILRYGGDKVAVNTHAVKQPELITEIAQKFGSQCMVLSIEAKRHGSGAWEALVDNGREHTGLEVVDWARKGVELGAGEVLLTSVDRDGTCKGFDLELISAVATAVPVPVIASGGMGTVEDLLDVVHTGQADAVAMASALHYGRLTLKDLHTAADRAGIGVSRH